MKRNLLKMSVVLCLILLCSCFKQEQPVRLRYDLVSYPETLDPQYATSSAARTLIENSFEGLTTISPTGEVVPACAERWDISNDRLTYIFTLRDGLRWANGDLLTANDFVFALQRLFNRDAPAPDAGRYSMIKNADKILSGELPVTALGVRAKGDTVLEITLEHDDPSLLSLLSNASAMPCQQEFFAEQKGRYGLAAENLLCNGPFFVKAWSNNVISVQKNPAFRNLVQIDGVEFYINRGDPVSLYLEGRSDLVFVPFQRLAEVQGLKGETFYDQSWMLLYNTSSKLLVQRDIRAALTAAMHTDELLERLPDYLRPYHGIIAPSAMLWGNSYREMASEPQPAALPDGARQIFISAVEGLEQKDVGRLSLLVSNFLPGPDLGGAIQRRWQQELSTFVNMEQLDYYDLLDRVKSGKFDIAIVPLTAQGNSPVDLLSSFESLPLSTSGDEPSISEMISRARQQSEPNAAAAQLFLAEQKLVNEYVAVPLFVAPSLFATGEGIEGVSYSTVSRTVYFADAKCIR
ncbi:MAG: peptide transporter substrate-binding protein [Oscillospiraceae bacterium]|jgi:ABC-type oligopeptide transport system substrate-binding subunit|nr:peptide transporter substrate-binding protein [Oscillospiraceae bacterium]